MKLCRWRRVHLPGAAESFLGRRAVCIFRFGAADRVSGAGRPVRSFIHPFIIPLTVPVGVTGALLALSLTGQSINLTARSVGVLLIGLMAKNGILIVGNSPTRCGRRVWTRVPVLAGASQRLRPILMTVLSTVLGAVPLALATGAGFRKPSPSAWW